MEKKQKGNSKINDQIKNSLYNCILHNPQVMQSPIFNSCLKVNIDGHTRLKIVPKLLLHVSVIELHKILVSDSDYDVLKEASYAENNIIISDSTLQTLFPPQLKIFQNNTRSCVVVYFVYLPKVKIPHYYPFLICIWKNSNIKSNIFKTEGLMKNKTVYMKHIKIHSCHMGVIFMPKYMMW